MQNDRKAELESIRTRTEEKKKQLGTAQTAFQDDLQRFQSIKSEMESINKLKTEEMTVARAKCKDLESKIQNL